MKNRIGLLLLMFVIITNNAFTQENSVKEIASNVEGSSLVLPKTRVIPIKDTKRERNYELYIKLPADYSENNNKTYPVLYYTDAMWHLEMLSGATEYMLEDIILVGISWQLDINKDLKKERGDHVSRFRDYSISKHSNPEIQKKYQLGQANNHLDFIRNDVIKYVDNSYRTDPNSRTYFGYSLSGEFGAYILMTQPDTFNNYIIGSPTIGNELDYLTELNTKFGPYEASNKNSSLKANVFIAYGSLEGKTVADPIEAFVKLLNDRRDDGLSVLREVIEGNHSSAFPTTTVRSVAWLSSLMTHVASDNYEVSFWKIPHLNTPFVSTTPKDRKDGISVDTLAVNNNDRNEILNLSQEIFEGKHGHYDALLISHKNKLVFESYYKKGRINLPHGQASAVKAYASLVLGRAIEMGYLSMEDLNKPLISFLKDIDPKKISKGAEKITLHKALTMHGGLTIDREKWKEFENDTTLLKGQGLVQKLLEQSKPITDESQTYLYGNFNPMLVMTVIDAVVPGTAEDFIKTELLDKLGITNYKWSNHVSGLPEAGWRVSIMSRDMIKLGNLVLNKGKWNNEQLISSEYLAKATTGIVKPTQEWVPKDYRYGYFWYQTYIPFGNKNYNATFAWGGGGQRVIVIEELDLTIVISGHDGEDDKIMKQVSKAILPAFTKGFNSTKSEKSDKEDNFPVLEGPYLGQKAPGLIPEVFAPGIVSTEHHEWGLVFTPDIKELYFSRRNNKSGKDSHFVLKSENNRWHESEVESGVGGSISPDGKTMFFANNYRERTDEGWSEFKSLGSAFKDIDIMRLTTSSKGTYVFDEYAKDGNFVLRYSRLVNGVRETPKPLSKEINSGKQNVHPFIAPDESYILWDSKRDNGYGGSDIYVSFRQEDGSWGTAINLGDKVNTSTSQRGGYVTPDGKYLFFFSLNSSGKGDIFWVDAQIIEALRPKL